MMHADAWRQLAVRCGARRGRRKTQFGASGDLREKCRRVWSWLRFFKSPFLVHRASGSRKSCLPLFTGALRARVTDGATIFVQTGLAVQNRQKNAVAATIFLRRRAAQRELNRAALSSNQFNTERLC